MGLTYQRIDQKLLLELLNVSSEAELKDLIKSRQGWTIVDGHLQMPARTNSVSAPAPVYSTREQQLAILAATARK